MTAAELTELKKRKPKSEWDHHELAGKTVVLEAEELDIKERQCNHP
jgi:hypothetical protein